MTAQSLEEIAAIWMTEILDQAGLDSKPPEFDVPCSNGLRNFDALFTTEHGELSMEVTRLVEQDRARELSETQYLLNRLEEREAPQGLITVSSKLGGSRRKSRRDISKAHQLLNASQGNECREASTEGMRVRAAGRQGRSMVLSFQVGFQEAPKSAAQYVPEYLEKAYRDKREQLEGARGVRCLFLFDDLKETRPGDVASVALQRGLPSFVHLAVIARNGVAEVVCREGDWLPDLLFTDGNSDGSRLAPNPENADKIDT